jgi:hypothetical protein
MLFTPCDNVSHAHIFASAEFCAAEGCATGCEGDWCAYICQGVKCGARCKGASCAKNCGSMDEDYDKPKGYDDDNTTTTRYNDDWEENQPGFVEQTADVDPDGRLALFYDGDDDVVFHTGDLDSGPNFISNPDFPGESVDCGMECEGTDCAKSCTAAGCGASCTGLNCAANCQGTVRSFVGRIECCTRRW